MLDRHPIERVSWKDGDHWLRRYGMRSYNEAECGSTSAARRPLGVGNGQDALDLYWAVVTDRNGWQSSEVTLRYETPTDIADAQKPELELNQAPTLDVPWTLVPGQLLDIAKYAISGSVSTFGHFALTIAPDPSCQGAVPCPETSENLDGPGAISASSAWLVANDLALAPVFVGGSTSLALTNYAIDPALIRRPHGPDDDWLISPGFDVEAAAPHLVQFRYEGGAGAAPDLDVFLGSGSDSAALSSLPTIVSFDDFGGNTVTLKCSPHPRRPRPAISASTNASRGPIERSTRPMQNRSQPPTRRVLSVAVTEVTLRSNPTRRRSRI